MIPIDQAEVLRYMGYKGQEISDTLLKLIAEIMKEGQLLAGVPRSVRQLYSLRYSEQEIQVLNTTLTLPGKDIASHLNGASECVIMAATLGAEIDTALQRYSRTDLTRSLILDAVATAIVEAFCDSVQEEIRMEALERHHFITHRFSPGYGDLPLDIQPKLLNVLQAEKRIGLTCSDTLIMLPRKSVTAIIGLLPSCNKRFLPDYMHNKCAVCSAYIDCQYRKDGTACDNP